MLGDILGPSMFSAACKLSRNLQFAICMSNIVYKTLKSVFTRLNLVEKIRERRLSGRDLIRFQKTGAWVDFRDVIGLSRFLSLSAEFQTFQKNAPGSDFAVRFGMFGKSET